ncbi:MAG TPA: hypothetical protein VJZ00_17995 [Thermoanaerobaculia bacterium]|nr:hypothetical protein [Thermoanaerobaculia bacterium]
MIPFTVAALFALPLVVLRGRTLFRYFATDAATWLFAWILWRRLPGFDPYLAFVAVAVLKLATFSLFLARGANVRWSALRAALLAAIVYSVAIPAMLRTPIDGDEPYYLLLTESMTHDRDLDLANQYRDLAHSATGRTDLEPQFGDPVGPRGERYSRHEPFLPLLMIPGYALGGLYGALATIALFGVLLVRSTIRWMEDEGISDAAARAVFPFFAFAPPVLFYATRIWPEVPAAFFFVEAIRGLREHRLKRWLPALLGLVLLKLRFLLVAVALVAAGMGRIRRYAPIAIAIAIAIVLVPLAIMWITTGSATSVHSWGEILPAPGERYVTGFFGLLTDGMSGIPFQAPFYLLGLFAITRWRSTPPGFRLGILGAALYILYLLPRPEWYGGWAPPLRYVVFVMPVLALGAAALWDRISSGFVAIVSAWTIALAIHGLAYPWRLFHEATGENAVGEWLSAHYHSDFSRLFPSFIRMNFAAWIGVIVVLLIIAIRPKLDLAIPLCAVAIGVAFRFGLQPAPRVEFEDAHVINRGGELYPPVFTMMRSTYRGGRILGAGDSLEFLASRGAWTLHAITGLGATIEIDGQTIAIAPNARYQTFRVNVRNEGRVTLRCLSGAVNLDRMERDG